MSAELCECCQTLESSRAGQSYSAYPGQRICNSCYCKEYRLHNKRVRDEEMDEYYEPLAGDENAYTPGEYTDNEAEEFQPPPKRYMTRGAVASSPVLAPMQESVPGPIVTGRHEEQRNHQACPQTGSVEISNHPTRQRAEPDNAVQQQTVSHSGPTQVAILPPAMSHQTTTQQTAGRQHSVLQTAAVWQDLHTTLQPGQAASTATEPQHPVSAPQQACAIEISDSDGDDAVPCLPGPGDAAQPNASFQDFSCWYPVLRGLNQLQLGPLEVDILMKGTWWNGTLVDLWARSFLDNTEEQIKDVTLLFNSFWYTKYTEALPSGAQRSPLERHSIVRSWAQNADVFGHKFLVFPIYKDYHWSYAVVCLSKLRIGDAQDDPCIIHMDSLGSTSSHKASVIAADLREWMTTEWQYQLDVNNANSVPFRKFPQRSRDFTRCFPVRSPAVPLQPNYNDCGMYASMNFYLWIRRVMLTKDLRKGNEGFSSFITPRWYGPQHVTLLREHTLSFVLGLFLTQQGCKLPADNITVLRSRLEILHLKGGHQVRWEDWLSGVVCDYVEPPSMGNGSNNPMFHAYHAVDHDCKAIMALNMRIQQTYVQKGLALPSSSPDASTQTNVTGRATNSIPTDEILKQYSHHVYQLFRTAHVRLTYCPLLPPPLPKATREISCQTEEAEGDLHHSHLPPTAIIRLSAAPTPQSEPQLQLDLKAAQKLMHLQELVTMKQKVALLQLNAEQMEGSLKYKLVTAEANTAAQQQEIQRMRLRETRLEDTLRLREAAHMDAITSIEASDAAQLQELKALRQSEAALKHRLADAEASKASSQQRFDELRLRLREVLEEGPTSS